MKLSAVLGFASLAVALPTETSPPAVDVQIERDGNSKIRANITNTGGHDLRIVTTGSLLDSVHVEKAQVFRKESPVQFDGVRLYINYDNLPETAFYHIPAGEWVDTEFDVAELHDLSSGGEHTIRASGSFRYALDDSTQIYGVLPYQSNDLVIDVDGAEASNTYSTFHINRAAKRAFVSDSCHDEELEAATAALGSCEKWASGAAEAARSGPGDKMIEYFKTDDTDSRQTVAEVYDKIAAECSTVDSGSIGYECDDIDNYCGSGATAYAELTVGAVVFCAPYWETIPVSGQCHSGDQAGIVVHEMSHMRSIKGTEDYDGYGYDFVRSLPDASYNLNHADTYMLFAKAIEMGC